MKKSAKFSSPISITGFADFEFKLDSINHDCVNFTKALDSNRSFTNKKQIHQNVSFSLIFVDTNGKLIFERANCSENFGAYFFETLDKIEEHLRLSIFKNKSPLNIQSLTDEAKQNFDSARNCAICHIKFDENDRSR